MPEDLLSLPASYDAMQDVPSADLDGLPVGLKHHPFLYVIKESTQRYSLAVLSAHGAFASYATTITDLVHDPARVDHEKKSSMNGPGFMLHTFRDASTVPSEVAATVTSGTTVSGQVVRTTHADDASEPPFEFPFQRPTPLCHVVQNGDQAMVHCLIHFNGTGVQLDRTAAKNAGFTRHMDAHGQFKDWRLEVPIRTGNGAMVQYIAFPLDGTIGIASGDVVRVKMASIQGAGGTGRSFAFPWP